MNSRSVRSTSCARKPPFCIYIILHFPCCQYNKNALKYNFTSGVKLCKLEHSVANFMRQLESNDVIEESKGGNANWGIWPNRSRAEPRLRTVLVNLQL